MKHLLFFLIVFPFLASAQILEKQFVATVQYSGFTQINDSLYRGDLIEFRDVLIEGYQPSGVDSGFICLDGTGRAYRVEVINSFDFSSLNVDLIELDDYDEIPIGVGIVAERYGSTYQIPNGLVNSIGISSVLQAKILNHNTKIAATTVQPPDTLYLQELSGTTAISNGDTIPLIDYVRVVDTPAMLLNYPSTAGYGIIDGGKTWRADTTALSGLATRKYTLLNPTSILADRLVRSNGTNLVAGNLSDNGTRLQALLPWQFQSWTTAGRPTGVTGYTGFNSTLGYHEFYDGSAYTPIGFWNKTGSDIYYSTGSVGINTSTFPAKLSIVASTSTSSAFALDIKNSSGANILSIRNDQGFTMGSGTANTQLIIAGTGTYAGIYSPGYSSGTANTINFRNYNGIAGMGMYMIPDGKSRTVIGDHVSASATVASAALEVRSTDKGFLPPRWTAAQLAAIPSPATSLIGYQTDGTEGLYIKAAAGFKRVLWEGDAPPVNIYTGNGTFGSSRTGTLTDSLRFQFGGSDLFRLKSNGVLHVNMPTETNSFVITSTPNENYNNYRGRVFLTGTTSAFDTTTGSRRNNHEASYFSGINLVEGGNNVYYDAVSGYGNIVRGNQPKNIVYGVYNTVIGVADVGVYGYGNTVSGRNTTVFGRENTISAQDVVVIGRSNTVTQNNSYVYGNNISSGTNLTLHGFGTVTPAARVHAKSISGSPTIYAEGGSLRASAYGSGAMEAADLSKIQSNYIAGFATDGTVLDYPISSLPNGIYTGSGTLANHTTRTLIPSTGNLLFSQTYNSTDSAYIQVINNLDGNREIRGGLTDTASTGFSKFRFYQDEANEEMGWEILTDDGTGSTAIGGQGGNLSLYADVAGTVEVRGQEIRLNNGEVSMNQYGQGNMKASDLSATDSKFVAKFGDAGKVLDYYLARDTFIEDVTLFSVGTLMNDCQELTVVSSMTATAPSHQEIRFPDAGDHLRGKKIIVYQKKKEAGIYVPQIKVVGGVSRLYFTTTPGIGGTDPSDQSTLSIDDSTWSSHGTTFEFTCLRIDNTPSYRWVLNQK